MSFFVISFYYDSDGNDDTKMYSKKKMLEAKRDKEKAKKRLLRMKMKGVFRNKNR